MGAVVPEKFELPLELLSDAVTAAGYGHGRTTTMTTSSVNIVRFGNVLGQVKLVDGVAVPDPELGDLLRGLIVMDQDGRTHPGDGQRYLDALPNVLDGPVWAEPVQAVTAAALNYDGPGGMVALYPLEEEAKAIARKGGEPWDDLHLTLFFFEDANDLPDELTVDNMGPLSGTISGIARFQEGPDGVPIIALPSVVGLNELRAYLTGELSGYSEKYGFIPHITLGYDEAEDPEGAIGLPVTFDHVCVASKDNKRFFPLA